MGLALAPLAAIDAHAGPIRGRAAVQVTVLDPEVLSVQRLVAGEEGEAFVVVETADGPRTDVFRGPRRRAPGAAEATAPPLVAPLQADWPCAPTHQASRAVDGVSVALALCPDGALWWASGAEGARTVVAAEALAPEATPTGVALTPTEHGLAAVVWAPGAAQVSYLDDDAARPWRWRARWLPGAPAQAWPDARGDGAVVPWLTVTVEVPRDAEITGAVVSGSRAYLAGHQSVVGKARPVLFTAAWSVPRR